MSAILDRIHPMFRATAMATMLFMTCVLNGVAALPEQQRANSRPAALFHRGAGRAGQGRPGESRSILSGGLEAGPSICSRTRKLRSDCDATQALG